MFFKKDETYILETSSRYFIGTFDEKTDKMLSFKDVMHIDSQRYRTFLKTSKLENVRGAIFHDGFACHEDAIRQVNRAAKEKVNVKPA